jgi:radical SAM superfamily enzyme YgiQ (UPF0313 family)
MCGIESLSDRLLGLLGKGVDAATVLTLLEWCATAGVDVRWNLLWGMPGERPEDYEEQVDLVSRSGGLPPPGAVSPILLERHSTLWREADRWGFGSPRPARAYSHIYPFSSRDLADLAYFFEHAYRPPLRTFLQIQRLARRVAEWQAAWARC